MHESKLDEEEKLVSSCLTHELQGLACRHSHPPGPFTTLSSSIPSNCPTVISRAAFEDGISVFRLFSTRLLFCPQHIFLPIRPRHLPQGPQIPSFSIYLQMRLGSCYLLLYSVLHFLSHLLPTSNPFLRFKLVKTKEIWKGHFSKHSSIIIGLEQDISSAFHFISVLLHDWRNPLPPLCYHRLGNTLHMYSNYKVQNPQFADHFSDHLNPLVAHTLKPLHHTALLGGRGLKHRPLTPSLKLSNS